MADSPQQLKRELGVFGAAVLGLGSIVGTGVFVSVAYGADVAGPWVMLAILLAGALATCNGLSSAQLAAAHPVSGGTYEYGYQYLHPRLGFVAGWMFLLAKSASAATAALGFAGYLLLSLGIQDQLWQVVAGLLAIALLTALVLSGLRRSNRLNTIIVATTIGSLAIFVIAGVVSMLLGNGQNIADAGDLSQQTSGFALPGVLEACALMFVAYTGYGRIATMGEEITEPRRNIPKAIIVTLVVSAVLYLSVAAVGVSAVDLHVFTSEKFQASPLEAAARHFGVGQWVAVVVAIGAIVAMLGVLLNLILGLSRVLLAMGRRGDMPTATARLNASGTTPVVAVVVVAIIITALTLLGDVRTTWTFSAFTVLIYYGLTNAAALRLPPKDRLYPRTFSWAGLAGCFFLAFWVSVWAWVVGLGLIALGLAWQWGWGKMKSEAENI